MLTALRRLFGADEPDPEPTAPEPAPDRLDQIRKGVAAIRADLGVYGTAVGVASGALVSTATYATFKDLFPVLGGQSRFWVALGLASLFVAVAATGSILITRRFFSARRRLVVDPGELHHRGYDQQAKPAGGAESLTPSEEKLIRVRLASFAQTEHALYARDIETRAHRLSRVAATRRRGGDDDGAAVAQTESDRLFRNFGEVVYDAQLMVIEMRAAEVYKGWRTVAYAALAAVGVASLFLLAAVYEGEREQIVAWNLCQKEAPASSAAAACAALDPRLTSQQTAPSPTADPITRLASCAALPTPTNVPEGFWEEALAACAGLGEVAAGQPTSTPTSKSTG